MLRPFLAPTLAGILLLCACGGNGPAPPLPVADGGSTGNSDMQPVFVLPTNCDLVMQSNTQYLACRGTFAAGQAAKVCPQGYAPTSSPLPQELRQSCDINSQWTFDNSVFVVDVSCDQGGKHALAACGYDGSTNATKLGVSCNNWPHALVCEFSNGLLCPDSNLTTASNTNPKSGAICVKQ